MGKKMGATMSRTFRSRKLSIERYLGLVARCPVDPVLVPGVVLACVLAELDGMAFEQRGYPPRRLRHLGGGR